ncbi:hypothetical protein VNO78_02725 [Psophocarpus tetragonolobus]|uniref:Uncharacterized protein n=1 Tax=Psophocarpus tetragonolobus TaxID=3891 RepID=A0AAN9T304_PSOTE
MEPHHVVLGGEEECHSNESGWTMYIGSPRDDEALHCDDDDDEGNGDGLGYDYDEGAQADPDDVESDDSMASDASSGPSHHGVININPLGSGYHGFRRFQQKEQVKDSDYKRTTNPSISKGNQVVKKNERVFINSKGKAPAVQNKVKVNKNHRVVGTRKL